jgi:hypothetical protein
VKNLAGLKNSFILRKPLDFSGKLIYINIYFKNLHGDRQNGEINNFLCDILAAYVRRNDKHLIKNGKC